ncbi:MAG TPA: Hint domain-containing protein [Rhodopila sp.]
MNRGTITATGGGNDGIYLNGKGIGVDNSGQITGAEQGIAMYGYATVTNSGYIRAVHWGLVTRAASTVHNTGTIIGTSQGIVLFSRYGTSTFTNSGLVIGSDGVGGNYGAITVSNAGTITGTYGTAVRLDQGGAVTNSASGVISNAGGYDDVYVVGAGSVINAGSIIGNVGVAFAGTSSDTLIDTGTIVGTGGVYGNPSTVAVQFSTGNDVLTFDSSASIFIQGTVDGGGGLNVLAFASSAVAGTLTGSNADFINFGLGTVDAGANWTFEGAVTFGGGVTLTDAGTLVDAGVLVNAGTLLTDDPLTVTGTLINAGLVSATGNAAGLYAANGGAVTNTAGGRITAIHDAVYAEGTAIATVTNMGVITSTDGLGIRLAAGGTVFDGGTITGGVSFGGTAGVQNLLILSHGYALTGGVIAPGATGNTLELLGTSSAGSVTVTYNSLGLTNFATVAFATGAPNYATLKITNDAVVPGTITGFSNNETIDLTNLAFAPGATASISGTSLVVTSGVVSETLSLTGIAPGTQFNVTKDAGTGSAVTLCFCAGTLIRTPDGEIRVEDLAVGDLVRTLGGGGVRPIKWIGHGKVLATRGRRGPATPVIVRKGALAENVPCRDLRVTKAHGIYIDDVLIPVEFLVNHRSIVWDDHAGEVALYHVELESHDILLADGAPAESYRDDGNRWLFQNANSGWHLPPQEPFAPVLTGGPIVDAVWKRLFDRAGPRHLPPMTDDPDLHLRVDRRRIDPVRIRDTAYVFRVPAGSVDIRIVSRDAVPAELGIARDPRALGVAIRRIVIAQGARLAIIDADSERLSEGFHGYEPNDDLRWTDGNATLPTELLAGFTGEPEVVLTLGGRTHYLDTGSSGGLEATRAA